MVWTENIHDVSTEVGFYGSETYVFYIFNNNAHTHGHAHITL